MLNLNLDIIIFAGFFIIYFLANFFYRTKKTSIDDYNHPNRNFSSVQIAATLISLRISSGLIPYAFIESYRNGLCTIIPSLFLPLSFLFVAKFISPRMGEFLGKYSVAQIMRELWGNWAAFITAISSILFALVILITKFTFISQLLGILLGIPYEVGILISAILIISYSLFARIKVSVFSDVMQFAVFSCIVPIILLIGWKGFSNTEIIWQTLISNPRFDPKHVLNFHNPGFYNMLGVCMIAFIPKFGPLFFPNISMSQNPQQSAQGFKIAGFILLILQLVIIFLAVVLVSENPNLSSNDIFKYCINNYAHTGLRAIICICLIILSLCISDFLLLSASAILTRDMLGPLGVRWAQNELLIFQSLSIIAGSIGSYIALNVNGNFMLMMGFASIFMTLVSPPLLFAIFGFRSSELSVIIGMAGSIIVMIIYQWHFAIPGLSFFIPGILANIIFLFGSHYLLKQTGGWLGIKGKREFDEFQEEKRRLRQKFIYDTLNINFIDFCKQSLPTSEANISFFGIFGILSIFLTQISVPYTVSFKYSSLLNFIYPSTFIIAANLVFYPIWPQALKKEEFLSIVWLLSVFYISIIIPAIFAFATKFLPMQMIIVLINFIAIFVMLKWNIAISLMLIGAFIVSLYLYCFADGINSENLQLQISYLLLFLSGTLISFLKPYKSTEKEQESLSNINTKLQNISEQTLNLLILKQDILHNLNQEIQTPIENIGAGAATLNQNKSNLEKHNQDSVELVYKEYQKLQTYVNKLVDLSQFETGNVNLKYQDINFQELVETVLNQCKYCQLKSSNVHFEFDTQAKHLITTCDPNKISQCLEYLINNAINFTTQGKIIILLENEDTVIQETMVQTIKCSIIDEGIGIPEDELKYIFGVFAKSSYTKNAGKGLGLALCQRIVELHHGRIWAENNKTKPGATFAFMIPRKPILS
ncbi:Putative alkaline phosphatase synthesis sensor protein PhoR [Candidatus Phycorickettsia trachydisci]|uniref:histidine kinase n=1 Tax=Candidatus Phycorickettsia trachydisci TaxID=2115978 RepID=A0A2P1P8N3_9RICK|nr:ATP-binding protein [Candidatus Phycorickettsia trachydisci]AVP87638.1 Putative alkaline phosphatase synthesis sensor protein PhoR [Candidatus Phycorickettsia trachydisci]